MIKVIILGSGDGSVVQWHDQKVFGSSPCGSSRTAFFSRVNFLCWFLFRYLCHPGVTTETCNLVVLNASQRLWQRACAWSCSCVSYTKFTLLWMGPDKYYCFGSLIPLWPCRRSKWCPVILYLLISILQGLAVSYTHLTLPTIDDV